MKRLILIFVLCGLFLPSAYGETISHTFPDGSKYVGEVKISNGTGKLHGQGTYTHFSGAKYVGEYRDNKQNGQGTLTLPDGGKYVGGFKDSQYHGQGTYTWPNGDKYVGEWKDDNKHGKGTLTTPDGKYVGEWKDGKRHGQATMTFPSGAKHVGEWKDDKKHGQGTHTYANGNKYVGESKDGEMHGQGTYTYADGEKYVGEYRYRYRWQGTQYNAAGGVIGERLDGMPAPVCNGNQKGGLGTGFAVNQYHVVTNAHVLYCCKKVTVLDLTCSNEVEATVVSTEQKSDLGLLRLDLPLKHYATLGSGKELALGEAVSTYDRKPKRNDWCQYTFGQGKVTKLNWMPDDSRLMLHDSPTSRGSSGGPLLDASGYVVGVSQRTDGRTSSSIKPQLLKAFLKSNNVDYKIAPSTEKLSLSDIKKKSDKFTVIIDCVR